MTKTKVRNDVDDTPAESERLLAAGVNQVHRSAPMPDRSLLASNSVRESFARAPDGTHLYVRARFGNDDEARDRPVVLLCDGLVCDGFIYKYLWDDLSQHADVAHFHYRAHGRSGYPVDPTKIDVPALAGDLDAVRRHLGDRPVILVGHSLGTQVSLEAYRARPDKIAGMVLLCGSFGRVTHTFKGSDLLANVLPKLIDFAVAHPKLARALWSRLPARGAVRIAQLTGDIDGRTVRAEDVEPYFRHVADFDFETFLRMLTHAGEHSAQDLLPHVEVPVLVIGGERDTFTPPELSEAMAEALPGSELLVIPGGTHVAPLEHPELVALRILKFLGERSLLPKR